MKERATEIKAERETVQGRERESAGYGEIEKLTRRDVLGEESKPNPASPYEYVKPTGQAAISDSTKSPSSI